MRGDVLLKLSFSTLRAAILKRQKYKSALHQAAKRFTNIQLLLINTSKYFYFYKYFLHIFVPMSKVITESAKAMKPVKKVKATKKTPKEKVKKESLFQPKYQFEKLDEVDKSLFYTGVSCQSLGTNFKQWAKRKTNPVWKARCFTAVMGKETGVKIIRTS